MKLSFLYIAALIAANLTVAALGPVATPMIAFFLIGLDLTLRDALHEAWEGKHLWPRMLALVAIAGAVSYLLNPAAGQIALASALAFTASAIVDGAVFALLRRKSQAVRVHGSNLAGGAVDSLIFPALAFGAFLPEIFALQLAAKVCGGAAWLVLFNRLNRIKLKRIAVERLRAANEAELARQRAKAAA
jgi:uncharacterized PurR-regulated membrane protein YhhQ (DUF165 family)